MMPKSNICISEYAKTRVPQETADWLAEIDDFLISNNCKAETSVTMKGTHGRFSYTSRKSKKTVCIMYITPDDRRISVRGNHFVEPNESCVNNILDELPKGLYDYVMKGAGREGHIVSPIYFVHNGVRSHRCKENPGWNFDLYDTANYGILRKWIEYEIAWKAIK
jgi:hypothetical protein